MFLKEEKGIFPELAEFLRGLFKKRGKDPPLVITSKPVAIKDILNRQNPKKGLLLSVTIHIAIVVSILVLGEYSRMSKKPASSEVFVVSLSSGNIYLPPSLKRGGGGGGGGDRSPQTASRGESPKISLKQLAPPTTKIRNEQPKLPVEPTVIAPPELQPSAVNLGQLGDILAQIVPPSSGPGFGGGIGNGDGGGIGSGSGPGIGPGSGGGAGGDVFSVGNGVIAPRIIRKIDPEFSDEARKSKHQGTVVLYAEIDTDGNIRKIEVRKRLGMGLDEKALEAVKQWKFKPGTKDGQPVIVGAIVEVTFRLL